MIGAPLLSPLNKGIHLNFAVVNAKVFKGLFILLCSCDVPHIGVVSWLQKIQIQVQVKSSILWFLIGLVFPPPLGYISVLEDAEEKQVPF